MHADEPVFRFEPLPEDLVKELIISYGGNDGSYICFGPTLGFGPIATLTCCHRWAVQLSF